MVKHLARMFDEANYAVLYEGIENDADENRCREMSAKYLQGYRYSKPVPIERLREFFGKETPGQEKTMERAVPTEEQNGRKCPVCGKTVFTEPGKYEICDVCGWEDDPVQFKDPDYAGGANRLSLNESRRKWNENNPADPGTDGN